MSEHRIVLAGASSGSGKTMITCGILQALVMRGMSVSSFKCGPDYIDPMFHEKVIGTKSGNLDLFFSEPDQLKKIFCKEASGTDISVIEGVMGYYDGLSAASSKASTYETAAVLDAPVILLINAAGQSVSALAVLQGFLRYKTDSRIHAVIFNRMSEPVFRALKPLAEEMGVRVLGYVPKLPELTVESRHLGLVTPDEVYDISVRLRRLAEKLEETVDIDALIEIAGNAPRIEVSSSENFPEFSGVRIGVARDEAFCFLYRANLEFLEELGAQLVYFSPIHDKSLPDGITGLILPGGYPELYAQQLSANESMRNEIDRAIRSGMPCHAECGGFLYLHRELADPEGNYYPMTGTVDASASIQKRLGRFGYITLTAETQSNLISKGEQIRGHEFHYYESDQCGSSMKAEKPVTGRSWMCIHATGNLIAGFPHLFYPSDPDFVIRFLEECQKRKESSWQK